MSCLLFFDASLPSSGPLAETLEKVTFLIFQMLEDTFKKSCNRH